MIRTVLRAAGLLASLASFMLLVTARGPSGEPSALERIPVLMDALEARLAEQDSPAAVQPIPIVPERSPRPAALPTPEGDFPPPPEVLPPPEAESLAPSRLPAGTPAVKVNRGLP